MRPDSNSTQHNTLDQEDKYLDPHNQQKNNDNIPHDSQNQLSMDQLSEEESNDLDMEDLLKFDRVFSEEPVFRGKVVTGTVVQVDQEFIYLNYGQKSEGKVARTDVDAEVEVNDQYNAVIIRPESPTEQAVLSIREANRQIAWDRLSAEEDLVNMIVMGKITKLVNKGYLVDVSGLNFFLPGSQLGNIRIRDASDILGKSLEFKVLQLDSRRKSGVLSHKQLLDDRRQQKWQEFLGKYKQDDIVIGEVKGITEYGVFIEIDGVKGLLHINDLSWKRNDRPKDLVQKGEEIQVKILKIDSEESKVSLGKKQLTEDPWQAFLKTHQMGDHLKGIITQLMNYGAFVEVSSGVEGLIHISELSWSRRINHPKQVVSKGDEVEVSIIKIDEDERRLSLSLKDVLENPWQKVADEYTVNDVVTGKVTKLTKFGAFVEIKEDVEGLVHINDLSWDQVNNPGDIVQEGQEIQFKIMELVPEERKISCSIKHLTLSPWEKLKQKYPPQTIVDGVISGVTPFGLFVELEPDVEGLVHISQVHKANAENIGEMFKKGSPLSAVVINVDTKKKRISLSIKDYEKQREKETIKRYMKDPEKPKAPTLGELISIDNDNNENNDNNVTENASETNDSQGADTRD